MRMEELSDNRYVKGTDTVERYLLNLVQEYFKTSNIAASTSKEYIIKKAVERMKEEISFDSIGVLSISLPDGEKRTGAVTISLEDLNGEPLITPKLTAFNVDFGTETKTACEGNDPRLSDARKPLEHKHNISDIAGLEGMLSTLTAKAERSESFLHTHNNKSLLDILVYTGNKSQIDLTELDTLEGKVKQVAANIESEIAKYEQNINTKVIDVNKSIAQVRQDIKSTTDAVAASNQQHYNDSKDYADSKMADLESYIDTKLNDFALTSDLKCSPLSSKQVYWSYELVVGERRTTSPAS